MAETLDLVNLCLRATTAFVAACGAVPMFPVNLGWGDRMRERWLVVAGIVLVVAGFTAERQQAPTQWEYAELQGLVVVLDETHWFWKTATGTVPGPRGTTLTALMLAIGCGDGDPMDHDIINFFNCVGPDGWEFATHFGAEGLDRYLFKRPVP